jgi:SAM-dependent methyltransferase
VVDFNPSKRYDLIVSPLSLMSVGWDEDPQDPNKVLCAINNLNRLLAPGGQIFVALGLGHNLGMDNLLKSGELRFDKHYYLKRVSGYRWKQVDRLDLNEVKYDDSIPTANEVLIGIIDKS